jgi:hypothetical protein
MVRRFIEFSRKKKWRRYDVLFFSFVWIPDPLSPPRPRPPHTLSHEKKKQFKIGNYRKDSNLCDQLSNIQAPLPPLHIYLVETGRFGLFTLRWWRVMMIIYIFPSPCFPPLPHNTIPGAGHRLAITTTLFPCPPIFFPLSLSLIIPFHFLLHTGPTRLARLVLMIYSIGYKSLVVQISFLKIVQSAEQHDWNVLIRAYYLGNSPGTAVACTPPTMAVRSFFHADFSKHIIIEYYRCDGILLTDIDGDSLVS